MAEITPERLREIEELYHAARENLDVLANADPELVREVESLLAHEGTSLPALTSGGALAEDFGDEVTVTRIAPGTPLGSYVIDRPLGAGGMGVVYLARDTKFDRPVAIKFLSDELDANARRRFQREAQLVSSLNHPHILTVHDTGEYEGRQYLVTEFVDGGTLKDWAKAEKRTWRELVDLLVEWPTACPPPTPRGFSIAILNRPTSWSPPTGTRSSPILG